MQQATVIVQHEAGLHARPASLFVKLAKQFTADIKVTSKSKTVSAKSLVLLLTLGVQPNTELELTANGSDEQEAISALVRLVESNFME